MKVHIFTQHGRTYTFLQVFDFQTNESVVAFRYQAQSDGLVKRAVFFVASIAGYSTMQPPEPLTASMASRS